MKNEELQIIYVSKNHDGSDKSAVGFLNNVFIYNGVEISDYAVQTRSIEKNLHRIAVGISLSLFILGLLALGYQVYILPPKMLVSLNSWLTMKSGLIQIFGLGILSALYLIYELNKKKTAFRPVMKAGGDTVSVQPPVIKSFHDVTRLPHRSRRDVSRSYAADTQMVIDKAFELSAKYGHRQIAAIDFIIACFSKTVEISNLVVRLGIDPEVLTKKISSLLGRYPADPAASSAAYELLLVKAYKLAFDRGLEKVKPVDIFQAAVMADENFQELMLDFGVTVDDLNNAIEWLRINDKLRERYHRYRRGAYLRSKSGLDRAMTSAALQYLPQVAFDLTREAQAGSLELAIGREKELASIFRSFETASKAVMLSGAQGVGKTAIIEQLAEKIVGDDVPVFLQEKRLMSLSVSHLLAGASASQAQQRLIQVFTDAVRGGNVILAIENVHELSGIASAGGVDLTGTLAELLSRNMVYCILTTEPQHYRHLEQGPLATAARLIPIQEMEADSSILVLESKAGYLENSNNIYFTYQAIKRIVELSTRYIHEQYLPQKAVSLLQEIAVFVKNSKGPKSFVLGEDVAKYLTEKLRIPIEQVGGAESKKLLNLEERIHNRIVGQDEAVKAVSSALRRARTELREAKRPIANFLFLGPTGVGKTELAKAIAEVYFGSEDSMIRLDMSEYQTKGDVYKLIGSAGAGENRGLLTEAIRKTPFAILLLDEIEKAHPDILNLFLQVMDDGRLTDASGLTVDFTSAIVIMTSNAGTQFIQEKIAAGMELAQISRQLLTTELSGVFRPEFLNRFDATIVFTPLTLPQVTQIAGLMMLKIAAQLEKKGIAFQATPEAVTELAQKGFDPIFGARPLRRLIQEEVDNALANQLLSGKIGRRDTVILDAGGKITVKKAEQF